MQNPQRISNQNQIFGIKTQLKSNPRKISLFNKVSNFNWIRSSKDKTHQK